MAKDRAEQTRHEYWLEVAIALKIFLLLDFKQINFNFKQLKVMDLLPVLLLSCTQTQNMQR